MAVDVSPTFAPAGPVYPEWWADGVEVIGKRGEFGTVRRIDLGWLVSGPGGYFANPNPSYWVVFVAPVLDAVQVARIAFDAAVSMYEAFGVGGVKHWVSLPDVERMSPLAAPAAQYRPELAGLRSVLMAAVRAALEPYVR